MLKPVIGAPLQTTTDLEVMTMVQVVQQMIPFGTGSGP